MKDFTAKKYRKLLEAIKEENIPVYGIAEWIKKQPSYGILIRHDIDRWSECVLPIAKAENELNISTTYYFRITKGVFKPTLLKKTAKLGHEVGYHYEDLTLVKNGDPEQAIKLFEKHLSDIRASVPVQTIAMHGKPLSKFDSRDLWKTYDFKEYDLIGEAFLSIDYSDFYYFTDTGRSWSNRAANIRDNVQNNLSEDIDTTDQLIEFIRTNKDKKIAITAHTERWPSTKWGYTKSYLFDLMVNVVKRGIILLRGKG